MSSKVCQTASNGRNSPEAQFTNFPPHQKILADISQRLFSETIRDAKLCKSRGDFDGIE